MILFWIYIGRVYFYNTVTSVQEEFSGIAGSEFGNSVDMYDNMAVVGAYLDTVNGANSGRNVVLN